MNINGINVSHILRCVLTLPRYHKARQEPPQMLYNEWNCCSVSGISRCAQLFQEWDHLQVSGHHS